MNKNRILTELRIMLECILKDGNEFDDAYVKTIDDLMGGKYSGQVATAETLRDMILEYFDKDVLEKAMTVPPARYKQ